jgi:hypothetical protein
MGKVVGVDARAVPGHQNVAAAASVVRSVNVPAALRNLPRPNKYKLMSFKGI